MSVRVKICGITRVTDATDAARAGADYLGYVFYPPSPRYVDPAKASAIIRQIKEEFPAVKHVAVTVNCGVEKLVTLQDESGVDFMQLHGDESPEVCRAATERGMKVIKALRLGRVTATPNWNSYPADYLLCDTFDPNVIGGTGKCFDIQLIPNDLPTGRLFLAGGLTPANVAQAINEAQPFAVDVSSGVEQSHGVKDATLVRQFISAVRTTTKV